MTPVYFGGDSLIDCPDDAERNWDKKEVPSLGLCAWWLHCEGRTAIRCGLEQRPLRKDGSNPGGLTLEQFHPLRIVVDNQDAAVPWLYPQVKMQELIERDSFRSRRMPRLR